MTMGQVRIPTLALKRFLKRQDSFPISTMMSQAIEQCCWHHRTPAGRSPKAMFAGDGERGALVKPADKMEQERASGLRERQIADLMEGDEVEACEVVDYPPCLSSRVSGSNRLTRSMTLKKRPRIKSMKRSIESDLPAPTRRLLISLS